MIKRSVRASLTSSTLALAVMGLSAAAPAWAQSDPPAQAAPAQDASATDVHSDDEIVVTARRRAENLQKVPVAITAVAGDTLEDLQIRSAVDLPRVAPGLSMSTGSTRGFSQMVYAIRGQRNGDPAPTADPAVGVYFADVPQNAPQGSNLALFDIGSVQVLKGPQGTLFGRNATGGAVLIEPNAPNHALGGYVRAAAGTYGLVDLESAVNMPFGDAIALRVAGKFTSRDGYLTDANTGLKFNNIRSGALRASLLIDPGGGFKSTTIANFADAHSNGEGLRLYKVSPITSAAIAANLLQIQALPKYQVMLSFLPGGGETTSQPAPNSQDRTYGIQNTTQMDLGGVTIKNIFGYRHIFDTGQTDGEGSLPTTSMSTFYDYINEYSEELQLSGETGFLTYVAGLYYFHNNATETIRSYRGAGQRSYSDLDAKNTSYSAYADFTFDLSGILPGLGASAGGRFTHDDRQWTSHSRISSLVGGGGTYTCYLAQTVIAVDDRKLCSKTYNASFERPTWEFTLNQQLNKGSLLYASYKRGYRTGGFSGGVTIPAIANLPYTPETLDAFELGSKNEFDAGGGVNVQFNVATYYYKYRDIQRQTTVFLPNGQLFNRVVNAAAAHIYGGEAELKIQTGNLDISAGYALTKPIYDKFEDILSVGGTAYTLDVSDSHFITIPEQQFNATVIYRIPVPESVGRPSLQLTYDYRSKTWTFTELNTANCGAGVLPAGTVYTNCYNHEGFVPGYGVVGARASWENALDSGMDISVFVTNLTNKYYFTNGIGALSSAGQGAFPVGIGPPRMVGLELRMPFGSDRR